MEIARLKAQAGLDWGRATEFALPEAVEKINAMTNIELLELIGRVWSKNA